MPDLKKCREVLICTFLFGLAAHGYCYFNEFLNHDSLNAMNYATDLTHQVAIGRYLRPLYCAVRGNLTLPAVNGFLTLFFLGLSIFVMLELLDLRNRGFRILGCGIMTVNFSVSLLNASYLHDADCYMFALLLAVLGVWLTENRKWGKWAALIPYFLSLGLYQAYIQAAVMLFLVLTVRDLLNGESIAGVFKALVRRLLPAAAAMVLYYLVYLAVLRFGSAAQSADYNSAASIELSLHAVLQRVYHTFYASVRTFLKPSGHTPAAAAAANMICLASSALIMIRLVRARALSAGKTAVLIFLLLLMPFGMNCVCLLSDVYHELTVFSCFISYLFVMMLAETANTVPDLPAGKNLPAWLIAGTCAVLIFDGCLYSNELYMKKELESKATLSVMTRVIDRMEQTEGYVLGETPVVLIGSLYETDISMQKDCFDYSSAGLWNSYSVSNYSTYMRYFDTYLGYPVNLLGADSVREFARLQEVQEMPSFPSSGCCAMVNGTIVVKLSEYGG